MTTPESALDVSRIVFSCNNFSRFSAISRQLQISSLPPYMLWNQLQSWNILQSLTTSVLVKGAIIDICVIIDTFAMGWGVAIIDIFWEHIHFGHLCSVHPHGVASVATMGNCGIIAACYHFPCIQESQL